MSSAGSVVYVYGVVGDDGAPTAGAPAGLDDAAVRLERRDGLAALVSDLDGATYGSDALAASTGSVDWVSPRGVVRSPIPRVAADAVDSRGSMVLNAAFLVAPAKLEPFQIALTDLVARHSAVGFRFDFTGPWPPYHFVGEAGVRGEDHD